MRQQDEDEKGAHDLPGQHQKNGPKPPSQSQSEPDQELDHPECGDKPVRIDPVDQGRDQFDDGRDAENFERSEPDEDDGK
jgi:hypothetical protein